MNILLISPNTLTTPYPVYPIGLDYVAGAVSARHQVRIVDLNCSGLTELAEVISVFVPGLIGISCRNIDNTEAGNPLFFLNGYKELIGWLRQRSHAPVVVGGSGFTIMPEACFALLDADYGIIGEGERFRPFVDALEAGHDVTALPGVICSTRPAQAPPPFSGEQSRSFGGEASHYHYYLRQGGMLNLQTKRGCSFRCIYCPYPSIEGRSHRLNAPDQVARTALQLQEAGARYLFITDSIFNSDVAHSLEVARAFKHFGLSIPWGGFFAPLRLPEDYFAIMRSAGLQHVEFGTESLSADMLRSYRKPFSVGEVFAAHRQARAAGLHVAHYFLLGGPGESQTTLLESLDNVERLEKTALFFFIGMRIYPGTPLYDIAMAEGKISAQTDLLEPIFYESDAIGREAIEELVKGRAAGRLNWVIGSGGAAAAETVRKLHGRNYVGPLWEFIAK